MVCGMTQACDSCGKSFTVHGLMNTYSPYSHYCRECADKKVGSMTEKKIRQEIEAKGIYATVTNFSGSTFPGFSTSETTCKNVSKDEFDKMFPQKENKEVMGKKTLTHVYIVFVGGLKKEVIGVYQTREAANKRAEIFKACAKDTVCHSLTEDVRVIKKRIIGVDNG